MNPGPGDKPPQEVVCGYCGTRNPAGGRCFSCNRVLPARGLQYRAERPLVLKRKGWGARIRSAAWTLFWIAVVISVIGYVVKAY
jgi:hypothetical protein